MVCFDPISRHIDFSSWCRSRVNKVEIDKLELCANLMIERPLVKDPEYCGSLIFEKKLLVLKFLQNARIKMKGKAVFFAP